MAEIHDFPDVQGRLKLLPMPEWMSLLQKTDTGYKRNAYNAAIALCHSPELSRKIAFDIRRRCFVSMAETPAGPAGLWADEHTAELATWLQGLRVPVKEGEIVTAMSLIARRYPIDPLADYLRGLQWDGQERLGAWLTTYCGAEDSTTNSLIGSKFLIGAVARALNPGCRMDYMLVLEGPQGIGKSTVVKILGGDYTAENLPDLHSKDAQQAAGNAWILEMAELAALRKSEIEQVKSLLTRTADTFRPPYGRNVITVPRWSVVIGNVNPSGNQYLQDTTGNRRFWPVLTGRINLAGLRRDRDQLWAEATHCQLRGDNWWVENGEQQELLTDIQADRTQNDEWEEVVSDWIGQQMNREGRTGWTGLEISRGALQIEDKDFNISLQMRLSACMKTLGFTKKKMIINGKRNWRYLKPETIP